MPAVVVVIIGLLSGGVWMRIKGRDSAPANAIPIRMLAKQFEWHVTYPGPDGPVDTADHFQLRN
mgnify:CR=1 FL=1